MAPQGDEREAREEIDRVLTAAGWFVFDADKANLSAGRGIAIREFPLPGHGFADYLLYVDSKAAGVIEAKKRGVESLSHYGPYWSLLIIPKERMAEAAHPSPPKGHDVRTEAGHDLDLASLEFLDEPPMLLSNIHHIGGQAHGVNAPGMAFFQAGDVRVMLGLPENESQAFSSILYYRVDDIEVAHRALSGRGVAFVHEPRLVHRGQKADLWLAFFRDPDGNTLALMSEVACRD